MKPFLAALLVALIPVAAYSADTPDAMYFTGHDPQLTPQERAGLAADRNWKASSGRGMKPTPGPDGSINFVFGASQPSIVCAVMQVCDIELQAGEQVNSVHLGDAARWSVEPAITGSGADEVQHLIIKPMDVGLNTSIIVTTNRRTYHLRLRSTHHQYMPRITFTYMNDVMKRLAAEEHSKQQAHDRKIIPETGEYLGNLDFKYHIDGDASWKPLRVYNDGKKTILEMPASVSQTEAPILLVVRGQNDDEGVMVNYRVQNNRYIVDTVFDKAILISGVGDNQERITVTRGE